MGIVEEEELWFLQNMNTPEIMPFAIGIGKRMYARCVNGKERTMKRTGGITKQRLQSKNS